MERITAMNTKQTIIISICALVIFISTIVLALNPNTSYYKKMMTEVYHQNQQYQERILNIIIPSVVSNMVCMVRSDISETSQISTKPYNEVEKIEIPYNYSLCGTNLTDTYEIATIHGWHYKVGDFFLARCIVSITPSCILLSDGSLIVNIPHRDKESPTRVAELTETSSTPLESIKDVINGN